NNGAVDQGATRAGAAVRTQVGTVSVDALRRLALLLFVKDRLQEDVEPYAEFQVPLGIPMPEKGAGVAFGAGCSAWGPSGQTTLSYEICEGAKVAITGPFVWPDASGAADQAADDLVVSAEATLVEGCPKAALPAALSPARSLGGVSAIDASA